MLRGYRLIDYLTQGYLLLVALLVLVFHGDQVPAWPFYLAGHAVLMGIIHALIRTDLRSSNRVLELLRHFYPFLLFSFMYKETVLLDSMFFQHHFDPVFLSLDRWIFGFQPSLVLMHRLPFPWVRETLYFSYFCYYLMIPGVGLALFSRDRETFMRYVTVVSVVFYCCYLTYIFLPVIGPRAIVEDIPDFTRDVSFYVSHYDISTPAVIQGGIFFRIMGYIYENVEQAGGAAFPSSHVAVALATLFFSWQFLKRFRWIHLLFVVLLMTATVYCRYHYVVDVFAGIATALVLVPIGDKLYAELETVPCSESQPQGGKPENGL